MKRALCFAIFVLALPEVLFATTFTTGIFRNGTSSGSAATSLSFTVRGSVSSITVDTGALTQLSSCPSGLTGTCFSFDSGSVMVSHGGSLLFDNALTSGTLDQDGRTFFVTFSLTPGPGVLSGSAGQSIFLLRNSPPVGNFVGNMRFGTTTVVVIVPEPGTLGLLGTGLLGTGLLGTGLIGLGTMAKRNFKPVA